MNLILISTQKFIPRILSLLLMVCLISCGRQIQPPTATPTITPISPLLSTATLQPSPSPTQTEIPLPKEPTLVSIIGKGRVYDTTFSPDRKTFAVSASDAVRVYQAKTHILLSEFPPQPWAYIQYSPDGKMLAVIPDGDLVIYDLETNQKVAQVYVGISFRFLAYKADHSGFALVKSVIITMAEPSFSWIEVYDFHSDQPRYVLDKDFDQEYQRENFNYSYSQAAFSPDGLWLSAADDRAGQVRTWDMTTGERMPRELQHPDVTTLAYSPDGRWLAAGGRDQVQIWDAKTNSLTRKLTGFAGWIDNLSFSADSSQLNVETGNSSSPLEIYEVASGKKIDVPVVPELPDEISPFLDGEGYLKIRDRPLFHPDNHTLVIPNGNQLVVWDLEKHQQKRVLESSLGKADNWVDWITTQRLAFHPEGELLAVIQADGSVDLWDITSGQRKKNIPSRKATTMTFSSDGKHLLIGGRQAVELWDVQSGQQLWQTYLSGLWIHAVEFSKDNQSVIAAASSGWATAWLDLKDGQVRQSFQPNPSDPWSKTIALQGQLLAAIKPGEWDQRGVRIWNVATGQVFQDISSYKPRLYEDDFIFSPDGRLITGKGEGNIKIWSTVTGQELYEFPEGLHAPVFSPNQQWIVLADYEGRLQLWDIRSLAQAPQLPILAAGPLPTPTPNEAAIQDASIIKTNCLTVQPTLSPERQLQGRLVVDDIGANSSYLLNLSTGERHPLPDNIFDLSTSPNGEWLTYIYYPNGNYEKSLLVFEDSAGKQRTYPMQKGWLFSKWLGNDRLSYSIAIENSSLDISPTQIISPVSGPYQLLASNYPDLKPYSGIAGSPYHYGGHSVEYDPTLRMVVYEKTDNENNTSMVLYDRLSGETLASFPDFYGEHYWNNPIWSADGQFFIASLVKDYDPKTTSYPYQEEWFRINRDGSAEQLTNFQDLPSQLGLSLGSISPDGKKFAFEISGPMVNRPMLAIMDLESKIVTNTCLRSGNLVWSPDGQYLVVNEGYERNASRMILIDLVNWQAEQISDDDRYSPAGWLKTP